MFDDQDDVAQGVTPSNLPVFDGDAPKDDTAKSSDFPPLPPLPSLPSIPSIPPVGSTNSSTASTDQVFAPIAPAPSAVPPPPSSLTRGVAPALSPRVTPKPADMGVPAVATAPIPVVQSPLASIPSLTEAGPVPIQSPASLQGAASLHASGAIENSAAPSALSAGVLTPAGQVSATPSLQQHGANDQGARLEDPFDAFDPISNTASPVGAAAVPGAAPAATPSYGGQSAFSAPGAPMGASTAEYTLKEPTMSRGLMTLIVIGILIAVFGGGSIMVYRMVTAEKEPDVVVREEDGDTQDMPSVPLDEIKTLIEDDGITNTVELKNMDEDRLLFGEPIDSDADGLSDDDEVIHGTDKDDWDSDDDDLSDADEVIIWETDPLNPDSDGDGYKDGEEVKNGYSPNGDGRLFELTAGDNALTGTDEVTNEEESVGEETSETDSVSNTAVVAPVIIVE